MSFGLLARIGSPADLKAMDATDLPRLCAEIRSALVAFGKSHGGHIGSNLGIIEATVALHRVFDSPRDRIIFDVSHQSYVHKMLTGRVRAYLDPDLADSVTGFTNPDESEHDQFILGHTGTSISLACGLAKTRDLMGGLNGASGVGNVIAVIGDGALSSAIAFEGLNNVAEQGGNLIIVCNDNEMSIAEDFGGMYGPLARLRASGGTAEPNIFHAFGLDYRYVEDGNDVAALERVFAEVRDIDHPIVVHIHTHKGLGLDGEDAALGIRDGRCEANHWQDPMSSVGAPPGPRKVYGELAMTALERRFADEPGLVAVSPATPGSNGITRAFRGRAGAHYVDTGIAEEHAVTFAAGIAKAGGRPVVATSSTFFQRTFDQLQQEVSLNRTPVTLLVFSAGISGTDNTHSGAFDIAMAANIPGLVCLAPTNRRDFLAMLRWSTSADNTGPVVIRVPGERTLAAERAGGVLDGDDGCDAADYGVDAGAGAHAGANTDAGADVSTEADIDVDTDAGDSTRTAADDAVDGDVADSTVDMTAKGAPVGAAGCGDRRIKPCETPHTPWDRYRITRQGVDVALIALGDAYPLAERTASLLNDTAAPSPCVEPISATVIDPLRYDVLDTSALDEIAAAHRVVVTIEDGQLEGGWGEKITAYYADKACHVGAADDKTATADTAHADTAAGRDADSVVVDNDTATGEDADNATADSGAASSEPRLTATGGADHCPVVLNVGARKEFTDRIPLAELEERYGMTPTQIAVRIRAALAQLNMRRR